MAVKKFLFGIMYFFVLAANAQVKEYYFHKNVGQIHCSDPTITLPVAYCELPLATVYISKNGLRVNLIDSNDVPKIHKSFHYRDVDTQFVIKHHVIDIEFVNSNINPEILYSQDASHYENYFYGSDENQWQGKVYPSKTITVKNVYPGIDFLLYTVGSSVEFDWVIRPGSNPKLIKLKCNGQDNLNFSNEAILISTGCGKFKISAPITFQKPRIGAFKKIPCGYYLNSKGEIGLKVGKYNKSDTLTIDPVLVFSTYSGSTADNFGFTATYDSNGCLYAGGIVDASSLSYPVTSGAFQTVYGGSTNGASPAGLPCDISISKYSPDGSKLLFATYLGGSSDEYPHSLSVDPSNNLLVLGTTLSQDFPVHKDSSIRNKYIGNYDIIVSKLSEAGDKMLAGTYVGGSSQDGFQINSGGNKSGLLYNYADNYRGDITTDDLGNIYVATCSHSSDFPTTSGAYQKTISGRTDAMVFSLSPGMSLLRWATFFGGELDDAAYSCRFDDSGNLFVGGGTKSTKFPIVGASPYQLKLGGVTDGFILKLRKDNGKYENGTYWGSSQYDQIYFLDVDRDGSVYTTGQTEGFFKKTPGTYGKDSTKQFISKLSNDLSKELWVTTFGNKQLGKPELSPSAFMVDDCYNIYFSGWGAQIGIGNNGTTFGLEITPDAHQKTTDFNDFYLIALKKNASKLVYASFFGGDQSEDHVDGGTSRFDKRGVIYQSVCSSCPNNPPGLNDFPTTSNAAFKNNVSVRCSNASFKLDFRLGYSVGATFDVNSTVTCLGYLSVFTPRSFSGGNYYWDFGDGSTSTDKAPTHLYTKLGEYTVSLKVVDTNSCNHSASSIVKINVVEKPEAKLIVTKENCVDGVLFQAEGSMYDSIIWNFGDQSPVLYNTNPIRHLYSTGDFKVNVVFMNSKSGCKDTIEKELSAILDSTGGFAVANVFTPNNDGKNDEFRIYGISPNCDEAELKIFNRWGERVYDSKDFSRGWNGLMDNVGVELPSGVYYYQLEVIKTKNIKLPKNLSGVIHLIRTK